MGRPGPNTFHGGTDPETVSYFTRTAPVYLTPGDNSRNDGELGEGDLIGGDVENAVAGSGIDVLHGTDGPNALLILWAVSRSFFKIRRPTSAV